MTDLESLIGAIGKPAEVLQKSMDFEERPFDAESEEPLIYFIAPENGLQFATNASRRIDTIWVSSGQDDPGFLRFPGNLIGDITFDSSRKAVRGEMGAPSASGEAESILSPEAKVIWDRYDFPTHALHFEYFKVGARLRRITIMSKARVPRM